MLFSVHNCHCVVVCNDSMLYGCSRRSRHGGSGMSRRRGTAVGDQQQGSGQRRGTSSRRVASGGAPAAGEWGSGVWSMVCAVWRMVCCAWCVAYAV